jgi:hypothetical protein
MIPYIEKLAYTDYTTLRESLFNNLYLEIPEEWYSFVRGCIFEIYDLCRDDGLDIRNITFEQIKEKYGTLRIYYTTPYQNLFIDMMFEGNDSEIPEDIFNKQNILTDNIDYVISKYDSLIRGLFNNTNKIIENKLTRNKTIDKHINNKL